MSPFEQLSRQMHMQASRAQSAGLSSAEQSGLPSTATWTPYELPEAHMMLTIHRVAMLRLTASAKTAVETCPVFAARQRLNALQEPLSSEQLVTYNEVCIHIWPDPWVRIRTEYKHQHLIVYMYPLSNV